MAHAALVLAFFLAGTTIPLAALGQKEAPLEPAAGLEDWEHDFDISKLPAGKYNIIVTGKDVAGNASSGGPINVFVDPASDLPLVSVINPTSLMRVGGDLNIVGTCVDDDGVARVEVSMDGGEWKAAQGGEFWSLYLGTKDLPDGRRTIAVRGVDINGLAGPVVKVAFNLDRSRPASAVEAPEPGALVAGQVKMAGTVADANGVAGLEASTDGGKTFSKVDLKRDKTGVTASFAFAVDTRKFPDGPRVVWLRSVDGVGSRGSAAFLLYVDNTKPSIELALPRKDQAVHGTFAVAGAVRDSIGIERLSYDFGGVDKGEIPLTPGNPFFAREFDASAVKGDKVQLVLTAVDRIGNLTRLEVQARIDREADKPRALIAHPAPGGVLRQDEAVWGAIADDDGGAGLVYTVDGGSAVELAGTDLFFLPAASLSAGRHLLSIRAKDIHGVLGDAQSLALIVDGGPASVSFLRLSPQEKAGAQGPAGTSGAAPASGPGGATTDYFPGASFRVDAGSYLEGTVVSRNLPSQAGYSVSGGSERKLDLVKGGSVDTWTFRIPLDRTMPYGFVPIEVKVSDSLGGTVSAKALLYSTDLSSAREDSGFVFDDPRMAEGRRVALAAGDPLLGAFYREGLESLSFDPPTKLVTATFEGRIVTVAAVGEGVSAPTRLVARTKLGHEFRTEPFVFACDSQGPRVSLDAPADGSWLQGPFALKGRIADAGGLGEASLIIVKGGPAGADGAAPSRPISLAGDGSFNVAFGASDLAQGAVLLEVDARDAAGNLTRAFRSLGFDSEAPVLSFLSPAAGAQVSGPEDVAALISDLSGTAVVEYAADGMTFSPIESRGNAFIHRADLAANPKAAYRVTDKAGNRTVVRPEVAIVAKTQGIQVADSLSVEVQGGEARVELSGGAGQRKLTVSLPALAEADFTALGFAESADGAFTKAPPPRFGQRLLVSGAVSLKGKVVSATPLKAVSLSLDAGATWSGLFLAKDAKGMLAEVPVTVAMDTSKVKEGESRWLLKLEDGAGALSFVPIYAVIDNAKPEIALVSPPSSLAGPLPLVLKASDGLGLVAANLSVAGAKTALPVAEGGHYFAAWADPLATAGPASASGGSPAPAKGGGLAVAFDARDAAGNAASGALGLAYDVQADAPRIETSLGAATASSSAPPPALPSQDRITLSASDDDAVPSLRWSIDGGEGTTVPTGAAGIPLEGLAPGRHQLLLEATDLLGRLQAVKKDFAVAGPAPALARPSIGPASSPSAWLPGIEVEALPGSALQGTVDAANGLASLDYMVNGGPALKATIAKPQAGQPAATIAYSCPLPAGLAYDRVVIEVRAKDGAGLETVRRFDVHNVLKAAPGAPPADTADALRFFSSAFAPPAAAGGPPLLGLKPGERVAGWWNGRPLRSLSVEGANGSLAAAFEGGRISLEAISEAVISAPLLKLRAETVDGDRFEWGPFALAVDAAPPTLMVDAPADASWQKTSVRITGRAEDPNGIVAVEASVNGGAFAPLPALVQAKAAAAAPAAPAAAASSSGAKTPTPSTAPAGKTGAAAPPAAPAATGKGAPATAPAPAAPVAPPPPTGPAKAWSFDTELPLPDADGAMRVDILARDAAGRESHVIRYLSKDSVAPGLVQVLPAAGESVNGTTTFIGQASDGGRVASIVFLPGVATPAGKDAKGAATASLPAPAPEPVEGLAVFSHVVDLAKTAFPLPEGAGFLATDKAGNSAILAPSITVDLEKDKPVVDIQAPGELEVIRADFVISGAVYDDDGVKALWYRIDGGTETKVDIKGSSFTVPLKLAETSDNEHLVEAWAEDIYGVKSDTVSRRFRVSTEEPTALMSSPSLELPVRGLVELSGSASDANGISAVALSFDNGSAYEAALLAPAPGPVPTGKVADKDPDGAIVTAPWTYPLDTAILKDGLHPITVRPVDGYDTRGFYATFITVDNTAPVVELSLPEDGSVCSGTMPLSGRVSDNIRLAEARLEIAPIGNAKPPLLSMDLGKGPVIGKVVDISVLPPGQYTVRLVGRDRAANETLVSRDIVVRQDRPADKVEILFPVEGQEASGKLRVYGRVSVAGGASSATILVDGTDLGSAKLDPLGWFAFDLPSEKLAPGARVLSARAVAPDGKVVVSRTLTVEWKSEGPWLTIDSLAAGAYLPERPYLSGHAGWLAAAPAAGDSEALNAWKKSAPSRKVARVDLSLDNGRTWAKATGTEAWKFRLETQDYPEGSLHVIARATFGDGTATTAKTVLSLDKTPPVVRIFEPLENGRFNGDIHVAGSASDASGLSGVGLAIRKGDKRGYELPAFIQGLYVDVHAFGATYWDLGAGLSFFQDNVKLQAMIGHAPEEGRFGGSVYGAKLLANIGYLPASFILGPDWDFLSASFALGANFSYFSMSSSGSGLVLGAVVAQVEFPKVTLKKWSFMRKFSLYTEGQAWFVSSDVQGGIEFRMGFGLRLGLF
jgi:hypothetical protein